MIRLSQVSAAAPAMPPPHKTTFLGRIRSYSFSHITNTHQYSLASSLSLMSPSYAKEQATLHHIISYTITCHVLLRNFFLWFFNLSLKNFPHRLHGTYSGTQLTCVPPLPPSSLTPAFLSHPIGCDAISSNGERMRRCWGGETKRPRDHPTHSGHKNLHSQDLSLVFPLPQGEKHIYNIYSDIFWLFDFTIVNTFIYHSSYSLTFPPCFPILSYYAASRGNCFPNHRIWFLTFLKVGGRSTFGYLGPSAGV